MVFFRNLILKTGIQKPCNNDIFKRILVLFLEFEKPKASPDPKGEYPRSSLKFRTLSLKST
jgi:hypothetical protein